MGRAMEGLLETRKRQARGPEPPIPAAGTEYSSTVMNGPARERFRDGSLVDFGVDARGAGRRLDCLGGVLVDRPLPQAHGARRRPDLWDRATAVYRPDPAAAGRGRWELGGTLPDPWRVELPLDRFTLALEVRPAPSGQVGVFAEQAEQWNWLAHTTPPGVRMLSLFAHSGAATLALAAAGAEVVHVDSSRQSLALARRNAAASGLADAPIRWVCEDAATFVAREWRRGNRYAGAVLDPPSWGHGPRGERFAIDADLPPLLSDVARLVAAAPAAPRGPLLVTCHAPAWTADRLGAALAAACHGAGVRGAGETGVLACTDVSGRGVELGTFARLPGASAEPARGRQTGAATEAAP